MGRSLGPIIMIAGIVVVVVGILAWAAGLSWLGVGAHTAAAVLGL